jgi:hypothetical protein
LQSFKENVNEYAENIKHKGKEWKEKWEHKKEDDFLDNSSNSQVQESRVGGFVGLLRTLVRAVFLTIGFLIKLAATLGIILAVFVFIALVFRLGELGSFPIADVVSWPIYYAFLTLAFLAVILPLSLLSMIGNIFMLRRKQYEFYGAIGIIGTWFAVMLIIAMLGFTYGPTIGNRIKALPEYQHVTADKTLASFDKIDASGVDTITIVPADAFTITATGRQEDIDNLSLKLQGDTLMVGRLENKDFCFLCVDFGDHDVDLEIHMPNPTELRGHGATTFNGTVVSTSTPFALKLSGASRADLALTALDVTVVASGASRATFNGTTTNLDIELDGASRFTGEAFTAASTTVEASGASKAYIRTTNTLDVDASGASKIYYYGLPNITKELSGAAEVEDAK